MALIFLLSASLNAVGKLALHTPRPSFLDPSLALRAESTFGVPSGHAQNAVVVWGYLAAALRRWWAGVAAGVLMALLGFAVSTVLVALGVLVRVVFIGWTCRRTGSAWTLCTTRCR